MPRREQYGRHVNEISITIAASASQSAMQLLHDSQDKANTTTKFAKHTYDSRNLSSLGKFHHKVRHRHFRLPPQEEAERCSLNNGWHPPKYWYVSLYIRCTYLFKLVPKLVTIIVLYRVTHSSILGNRGRFMYPPPWFNKHIVCYICIVRGVKLFIQLEQQTYWNRITPEVPLSIYAD